MARMLRITIDGPAGAGKSTVARELAQALGYTYLDTGAMYRTLALAALRSDVPADDEEALLALLASIHIELQRTRIVLDGEDVADEIRQPAVDRIVARVAAHPGVRAQLVERQRAIAQRGGIVMDGRDTGTVVLPNAECKFFLTASAEARVERRHREQLAKGVRSLEAEIRREMEERDALDEHRAVGALRVPDGAVVVDTTGIGVEDVVQRLLAVCREKGA